MSNTIKTIRELAAKFEPEIVSLRRHFHAHPELSWKESRTTDRIEEELKKLGIPVLHRGYDGTDSGLVADIVGGAGPGKRVALRADIDALPVTEENDIEYRSQNDGVMHACGHDCHAAGLLGAAMILNEIKGDLKGTVRLLFQPAEESGLRSGAKAMLNEGALEGVDAAFGIHVSSNEPSGVVKYCSGPAMAACDEWDLTITGKGGHGSAPEGAIDPTVAAFQIGAALQTVVSREVAPKETAVLSTGSIATSSNAFNIIPERVTMRGTVRTFRPEVQDTVQRAMERICSLTGQACRCAIDLNYKRHIPATVNDPGLTDLLVKVGGELLGPEAMEEMIPLMGSEDFSYFCNALPATYAHLGTANPKVPGTDYPHHSAKFNVDEAQLKRAAALYAAFAWSRLAE